ncbi:hypothetical protein MMAGJ_23970 [Mycolicibacterium mageritense]|uniref:Uncharacterized protein n=1 Tax=Mycolicibacterium mageritense TaxID=53462 RepID=A0ABM7HRE1_MYCME|nr:hypothetical protein MMAGJ_23970 [Mycolicibacterium mageritense]
MSASGGGDQRQPIVNTTAAAIKQIAVTAISRRFGQAAGWAPATFCVAPADDAGTGSVRADRRPSGKQSTTSRCAPGLPVVDLTRY